MGLFHDPYNWGEDFDLAISQSESPLFTFDTAVNSEPKIVAISGTRKVREYTENDGLVVSADRLSVTWQLNGSDFIRYPGQEILFQMTFFVAGAIEYTMKVKIIPSKL